MVNKREKPFFRMYFAEEGLKEP